MVQTRLMVVCKLHPVHSHQKVCVSVHERNNELFRIKGNDTSSEKLHYRCRLSLKGRPILGTMWSSWIQKELCLAEAESRNGEVTRNGMTQQQPSGKTSHRSPLIPEWMSMTAHMWIAHRRRESVEIGIVSRMHLRVYNSVSMSHGSFGRKWIFEVFYLEKRRVARIRQTFN